MATRRRSGFLTAANAGGDHEIATRTVPRRPALRAALARGKIGDFKK
jgi:hypothetical protein